ncbi:retrovirus-related pol polyprotein from transposon TNT 1-94 [Tanacetum coccineum]
MLTMAENVIAAGAENRPPMLDKSQYSSWRSRMLLYIKGKEHGKQLYDSIINEPFKHGTIEVPEPLTTPATIKDSYYDELTDAEKICEACDIKSTNIVLQGLPQDIYKKRIKVLINDMHSIGMSMQPLQVNTKVVNHLQPEWRKFVTDVMLAKDMHNTNFDHLYAYLRQHEAHANEVRLMRQRYPDPLALHQSSLAPSANQPSVVQQQSYQTLDAHQSLVIHHQSYQAHVHHQSSQANFPHLDSGLVVPSFLPSDDPIASLKKALTFISTSFASQYPPTNNHLRTSSNPRNQATIQDDKEIPTPAIFQTDDLDTFDFDCDEAPSTSTILMAKLSAYDLDILSKVPNPETYQTNTMVDHIIHTIVKQHDALCVMDTEETLILVEESRLKMHAKQNDPIAKDKKVNIAPIDYAALNKLSEHFVPQKKLSAKQAFWLPISKPVFETPPAQPEPVLKQIPRELPTISLFKDSFNKMRSHVNNFDKVITVHTKVTGQNEGTWGFEHIRRDYEKDVKPFVKTLKEYFYMFDQDRKCFEIQKKNLFLENDRLLELIISQDLVHIAVNSLAAIVDYQSMEKSYLDEYNERTFTIDGNTFPLTRITSTTVVPPKQLFPAKVVKKIPPSSNNLGEPKQSNVGTIRFGNDHVAEIIGYGNYKIGNVTISQVYYVEGCRSTQGIKGNNFVHYVTRRNDKILSNLSRLKLQRPSLGYGIKGKRKKHTHKPKVKDFIQEKLYMLHMDLCSPMRIESINGKKYILVFDDYSRFTWLKFLRSKDETLEFLIKFLKQIQVRLNATVRNIRTNNGTEFVNQMLKAYYEDVRISHQILVARTLQQNGAEAVATTFFTQNLSLICNHHNKTPYELLHDKKPDLTYFHLFGTLCYPTNDSKDLVLTQGVEEQLQPAQFDYDPFQDILTSEPSSQESSSNLKSTNHQPLEHLRKWTKNHLLANVIGNPSRPVST